MKLSAWPRVVLATGFLAGCGSGEQLGMPAPDGSNAGSTSQPGVPSGGASVTSPEGSVPETPPSGSVPGVPQPSVTPTDTGAAPGVPPAPTNTGDVTSDSSLDVDTTPDGSEPDEATSEPGNVGCEADTCPFEGGISNGCTTRFALGINYAWHDFGADFGGLAQWGMGGITATRTAVNAELADMRANGVSVVRWWMFPDFRGDGVVFDASGNPTGLSETARRDIQTALELAAENDLYVVLTLFSFDNFRPARVDADVEILGITPLVTDATRRAKLIENIVVPAARAAKAAPHAERLLGWDVINEPEWAIEPTGTNDQDFTPNDELDAVSLTDMKALINETLTALATETPHALRSVGWAAAKWAWAFNDVTNVDFHQPHIYGWVDQYWPYTQSPTQLGYTGKPTVMGEFYLLAMPFSDSGNNVAFSTIVSSWYDNGYAGAWAWSYTDKDSGPANLPLIKAFADTQTCDVSF